MGLAAKAEEAPESFGGYVRGEELGRGAFACVFACKKVDSGERFAAKAIDLRRLRLCVNLGREVKKLQREARILKKVPPHANLVHFVDIVQEGDWLFFILELVTGGNLFNALMQRPGRRPKLQESEARFIFSQLVEGIGLLHGQGIIHRDLKLENVLVVRKRTEQPDDKVMLDVKIADFGLSKVVGEGLSDALSTVGSPRYMAPEVIAKGAHDFRADLWSLGVLLYVLLDGKFPCGGTVNRAATAQQNKLNAAVAKLPISAHGQAVVLGLLQLRPEARCTIGQLRQHPWLAENGESQGHAPNRPSKRPRLRIKPPPEPTQVPEPGPILARGIPRGPLVWGPKEEKAVASAGEAVASAAAEVTEAFSEPRCARIEAHTGPVAHH